jgi:aspartate/tyrosine/aromatic aminotransferase
MENINKTIAMYRDQKGSYTILLELTKTLENNPDYVRITKPMDVVFVPRDEAAVQGALIVALVVRREALLKTHEDEIEHIDTQLHELRALTAPVEATNAN